MDRHMKLRLFLGKPIEFNGVLFFSPTVDTLSDMNFNLYATYILFATFDKDEILKRFYTLSDEQIESLEEVEDYELLTSEAFLTNSICESLSFFTNNEFSYNSSNQSFEALVENERKPVVNRENYKNISDIVKYINGFLDNKKEKKVKYKNKKARELAKEMEKMRERSKKNNNDSLDLKDILSILCAEDGNGITVFNAER